MSHVRHERPTVGDLLYEAFFSGAVGGSTVALFFLGLDGLAGHPFFTPSFLGGLLLGRPADPGAPADMAAVAVVSAVHFVAFGLFGLLAAVLVRWLERWSEGGFAVPALALLVVLEGASGAAGALLVPGAAAVLGHGPVLLANVLAVTGMTLFLRHAHLTGEAEGSRHTMTEAHPAP